MLPDYTPEQRLANKFLKMTTQQFNAWAEQSSLEEVARVTQIIQVANQQLREAMECLQEEAEYYIEEELDYGYFPEAESVLTKFTLKGKK